MKSQLKPNIVESPCINKCSLDDDNICFGCYRSISEIIGWAEKTIDEQKEIIEKSLQRNIKINETKP